MRGQLRGALLLGLAAAAFCSASAALDSIHPAWEPAIPQEIYGGFLAGEADAAFYIRAHEGYVAVFERGKERSPRQVTAIPVSALSGADRAMLQKGIPVATRRELLQLLEDLGP